MYRVTEQIVFNTFDKINKRVIFEPGMELDYKRMGNPPYLQISCDDICIDGFIEGPDFPILDYVEPITEDPLSKMNKEIQQSIKEQEEYTKVFNQGVEVGKSMKEEEPYTVQFKICDCIPSANRFMKTIPGKNFIDIKIRENYWLIVYKEYENDVSM